VKNDIEVALHNLDAGIVWPDSEIIIANSKASELLGLSLDHVR
jgi:hypothetical protein